MMDGVNRTAYFVLRKAFAGGHYATRSPDMHYWGLMLVPPQGARAGLEIGTGGEAKPLEAAALPPGSRFSDFVVASDGFSPSRQGIRAFTSNLA